MKSHCCHCGIMVVIHYAKFLKDFHLEQIYVTIYILVHLLSISIFCEAVASLPATVGSDEKALTPQTLSGLMANPVKLQNCLSSNIAEENAAHVLCKHLLSSMLQGKGHVRDVELVHGFKLFLQHQNLLLNLQNLGWQHS